MNEIGLKKALKNRRNREYLRGKFLFNFNLIFRITAKSYYNDEQMPGDTVCKSGVNDLTLTNRRTPHRCTSPKVSLKGHLLASLITALAHSRPHPRRACRLDWYAFLCLYSHVQPRPEKPAEQHLLKPASPAPRSRLFQHLFLSPATQVQKKQHAKVQRLNHLRPLLQNQKANRQQNVIQISIHQLFQRKRHV